MEKPENKWGSKPRSIEQPESQQTVELEAGKAIKGKEIHAIDQYTLRMIEQLMKAGRKTFRLDNLKPNSGIQ